MGFSFLTTGWNGILWARRVREHGLLIPFLSAAGDVGECPQALVLALDGDEAD